MTEFLGESFVKADGTACGREVVDGYKLIMVVYSASWWGGCTPFKASLKNFYNTWNAGDAKNLQVVIVSGDKDQGGYDQTMREAPWVSLPLGADKSKYEAVIPCTGYPTPGVINGATGAVIDADAFGKVSDEAYAQWMSKLWKRNPKKTVNQKDKLNSIQKSEDELLNQWSTSDEWICMERKQNILFI